jgi:hypothetical protein
LFPLALAIAILHRHHHPIEGHSHRNRLRRDRFIISQDGFKWYAVLLPVQTERFGQAIERTFRWCHIAQQVKALFALLGREMGHGPARLLGRERRPVALDHPGAKLQGTNRPSPIGGTIQAALDSYRADRAVVGRFAPQHLTITLTVDLDLRDVLVKARELSASSFTLRRHEEVMQLLLDLAKVFDRLRDLSAAQEVLKLVHGGRIAGQ